MYRLSAKVGTRRTAMRLIAAALLGLLFAQPASQLAAQGLPSRELPFDARISARTMQHIIARHGPHRLSALSACDCRAGAQDLTADSKRLTPHRSAGRQGGPCRSAARRPR